MNKLSKLVLAIESAIVTSATLLWNTVTQIQTSRIEWKTVLMKIWVRMKNEQIYGPQDGPWNYHLELREVPTPVSTTIYEAWTTYPYQPLCIILVVITIVIALAYLVYRNRSWTTT